MHRSGASETDAPIVTTDIDDPESLHLPIVRAVAAVDNEAPTDLPPLTDVVDPETLAAVVSSASSSISVSFSYCGYDLTVTSSTVSVY